MTVRRGTYCNIIDVLHDSPFTSNVKSKFSLRMKCIMPSVRGRVDRLVDLETLATHRCGFEFHQRLFSYEKAIQLNFGTSMVPPGCPLVAAIM